MEKNTPHYLNHRKRLKERFMKAPEVFTDAELLELMLGYVIKRKDVKPQAKELLAKAKKLPNIFNEDLKQVKGLGIETRTFLRLIQEFLTRLEYQEAKTAPVELSTSNAVYKYLKSKIGFSSKENFILLLLDSKNKLKNSISVRTGSVNNVAISARDVIEHAIENNATSVIMAHNHPSNDCTPSESDLKITKQICRALKYTGITLLDHIIVSPSEFYSMSAHGLIEKYYKEAQ